MNKCYQCGAPMFGKKERTEICQECKNYNEDRHMGATWMGPLCDVCDEVPGRIVYVNDVTYDDMMVCFNCYQVLKKKD